MSFIDHFQSIEDPRSHIHRRHDLMDVLFLTLSAILSGAEGWKEIEQFGRTKLDWLRQFRGFEAGIPVDDTIARIISALNPEQLMACFIAWANEVREAAGHELIALDGKTFRHAFSSDALHTVSAWSKQRARAGSTELSIPKRIP